MRTVYRIVIETYEPGQTYPIVVHTFQGKDAAQAEGFVRAHDSSDAFFRECGAFGLYAGQVHCRNKRSFAGWVEI